MSGGEVKNSDVTCGTQLSNQSHNKPEAYQPLAGG